MNKKVLVGLLTCVILLSGCTNPKEVNDLSNNSLGVEIASKTLFDKSVRDLNLSEAALLVGIFNNPTAYNPFYNPNNAYKRRQEVLGLMVKHGYITSEEANIANSIPVDSLLTKTAKTLEYQSYIDTVREELINKYGINPTTTSLLVYLHQITFAYELFVRVKELIHSHRFHQQHLFVHLHQDMKAQQQVSS